MYGSLGAQIRHYRRLRDMTQEELALQAGYQTKASINKIEKNQATVPDDRLKRIASALRVDVSVLTGGSHAPTEEALANYAYNSTTDTAKKLRDHLLSAMKLLDQENATSEIEAKFNRLTPPNQKSVMDMIDFLLAQQKAPSVKGEGS
jgi:transcriptional regulator with XRE-family HTH domain